MQLRVHKVDSRATLPKYSHHDDAGMDLFALETTCIGSGERAVVRTGISVEIPNGCVGLIWDKSGVAVREDLKTLGGVIDAGYRGEILIGLLNASEKEYVFEAGHKVAQMLIQKIEHCDIIEAESLSKTVRGSGGFGSTGK